MKKYILILSFLFLNCKTSNNNFLNDFPNVNKIDLEKNFLNPNDNKVSVNDNKKKLILNQFLLPLNSTENVHYYSSKVKNSYYLNYKYEIDKNIYLVCITENYGHLIDYNQYVGIYNSKEDKIKSVLLAYSSNRLKKINSKFQNNMIIIESIYKNNVEKGFDLDPNIDNSIKIIEKYSIKDYFIKIN